MTKLSSTPSLFPLSAFNYKFNSLKYFSSTTKPVPVSLTTATRAWFFAHVLKRLYHSMLVQTWEKYEVKPITFSCTDCHHHNLVICFVILRWRKQTLHSMAKYGSASGWILISFHPLRWSKTNNDLVIDHDFDGDGAHDKAMCGCRMKNVEGGQRKEKKFCMGQICHFT